MMAVGTAISFMGAQQQAKGLKRAGDAARRTAEFNRDVRLRNERVALQGADLRERVGDREALRFRKKFSKLQARAETAYRKGGVAASTGTPLQVLAENAGEAEEEVQLTQLAARTEAGRLRESGVNQRLMGDIAMLEGNQRALGFNIQAKAVQTKAYADAFQSMGKAYFSYAGGGGGQIR